MNYKGGDLVRVKTIKEMFETAGFSNIVRQGTLEHRTETCSWDMMNEYQLQRSYPARIVKLSYNTGTIWVVEGENFILGEWMIADSVRREVPQTAEEDMQPDRLTQLEDGINDFEEGYRQSDRSMTNLSNRMDIIEQGTRNFWLRQQELEDKMALLTRSIERTTDISGRF